MTENDALHSIIPESRDAYGLDIPKHQCFRWAGDDPYGSCSLRRLQSPKSAIRKSMLRSGVVDGNSGMPRGDWMPSEKKLTRDERNRFPVSTRRQKLEDILDTYLSVTSIRMSLRLNE